MSPETDSCGTMDTWKSDECWSFCVFCFFFFRMVNDWFTLPELSW